MSDDPAAGHAGRIGPNAVTRLAEALTAREGAAATRALFAAADLLRHLDAPPERMVPEADVVALHRVLAAKPDAQAVAREAGRLTALYLLARRIPKVVQAILRVAPPSLAARVLLGAIGRNAWTFAGTGVFRAETGAGARVRVEGGPFADPGPAAAPLGAFYAAVFETLFRTLVSRRTEVEVAVGGGACALALGWRGEALSLVSAPARQALPLSERLDA